MTWTPESLSPAMIDVRARLARGWTLESREVPAYMGRPAGTRYWLRRPEQRNSPRVQVDTITIKALRRRGLL